MHSDWGPGRGPPRALTLVWSSPLAESDMSPAMGGHCLTVSSISGTGKQTLGFKFLCQFFLGPIRSPWPKLERKRKSWSSRVHLLQSVKALNMLYSKRHSTRKVNFHREEMAVLGLPGHQHQLQLACFVLIAGTGQIKAEFPKSRKAQGFGKWDILSNY